MSFESNLGAQRARTLALLLAMSMFVSCFGILLGAEAATPNVSVVTQTSSGSALTGYWVEVTDSSGAVVTSGFSPAQFTLAAGTYSVAVGDYGGEYFSHWTDGTQSRSHPLTVTSASDANLTAVYCTQSACGGSGSSILVNSQYVNGTSLKGMYTVIQQGSNSASGFTPFSFSSTSGTTYSVTAGDYTNAYFSSWSNGVSTRTVSVTANSSQTTLTALYCQTPGGCGSSGGGTSNSITVTSADLFGNPLTGFFVDLRLNNNEVQNGYSPVTFTGLQTGVQYLVVVYWYGDYYFRHFANGNLQRYADVTLNSTNGQNTYSMAALYENVPSAKAASLNIIAQFPNGTQLGTAYVVNGYPQHTPGMYLDVSPPTSSTPFTATFTGGSILPFIFFNNQTYTVYMSAGYKNITFSYWKDNNSTSTTRAVKLQGNTTIIAIYTQS
jgi:hypothetical protein